MECANRLDKAKSLNKYFGEIIYRKLFLKRGILEKNLKVFSVNKSSFERKILKYW